MMMYGTALRAVIRRAGYPWEVSFAKSCFFSLDECVVCLVEESDGSKNQLVSEDHGQYLTTYTYDTYGNIRSIWVRDSETYSAVLETYEFSYADDRDWKDQELWL